ncbi:hypothetical protein NDU88_002381 [Pleurodeles waltl]|uniref:Uncharacterized protein n=1 Tax=Pleurodeles waltl TaxID=8319 RepID=A0AAV7UVF2_PLEWA|nr:hypothetical protein NDU88_002381 [Pleurodeles waltl]
MVPGGRGVRRFGTNNIIGPSFGLLPTHTRARKAPQVIEAIPNKAIIIASFKGLAMAEKQFNEQPATNQKQEDLLLAEAIVHALDASEAQSVNRALAVALQPIARQLKRYALTVPPYGQPTPGTSAPLTAGQKSSSTNWSHAAPLARLSQSLCTDHEYYAQPSTSNQVLPPPPDIQSDDSPASLSGSDEDSPRPKR